MKFEEKIVMRREFVKLSTYTKIKRRVGIEAD